MATTLTADQARALGEPAQNNMFALVSSSIFQEVEVASGMGLSSCLWVDSSLLIPNKSVLVPPLMRLGYSVKVIPTGLEIFWD